MELHGEKFREILKPSQNEIDSMNYYADKIRKRNDEFTKINNRAPLMFTQTFGCQMNVRDSETLCGILTSLGYEETKVEALADIIIYNTCCVRENAENKVYGNLGYLKTLKKKNPDLKVILCGCMMQQDSVIEKIKSSYRNVDVIFGTFNIQRLPELLWANFETNDMIIDVWENAKEIVEDLPSIREKKFKASVNIMYGCNNFCTYCIVPYVRGRERSREPYDILAEIKTLADDGVKEIMLLGQNVNSYGLGLKQDITFAGLLREVNKIDGIERIRFVTSHPKDLSIELIKTIAQCDKICNHLHLPFQSGSTRILDKMNRKYTKEDYLNLVSLAKQYIPDVGLSTDIIVGFPGETDEDFEDTIEVAQKCGFCAAFTFIYSKRTGTPAAEMNEQVSSEVVKNRFNKLLDVVNDGFYNFNKSFIGKTVKVLAEEINEQNPELLTGRTEQNTIVHFKGTTDLIGQIVDVVISDNKSFYMVGDLKL